MIAIGSGCRTHNKIKQNDIAFADSITSNKQINNSTNKKSTLTADNNNLWPDEIPIPSAAIINQNDIQKKSITPSFQESKPVAATAAISNDNTTISNDNAAIQSQENQNAQDVITPPRKLDSLLIEPKQLDESSKQTKHVNNTNSNSKNEKNSLDKTGQINSNKTTTIETVSVSELTTKQQIPAALKNNEMTLQDFQTLLTNAVWQPNVQLEHWTENGLKKNNNYNSITSRERLEEIKQLNQTDKEKLTKNKKQKYIDQLISTWRWYNNDIDEIVKKQLDPDENSRPVFPVDPKIFLENENYKQSKYKSLRSNAAILMGRCKDYDAVDSLVEIVKNERLDTIRCAAVETLAQMEHVTFETLIPLLEFARKRNNIANIKSDNNRNDNDSSNNTNIDQNNRTNQIIVINKTLWIELLTAISQKISTWEHPCFLDALSTDNIEVRRTCAKLWRIRSEEFWSKKNIKSNYRNKKDQAENSYHLPKRFLVFVRLENDLQTRIDMIKTLGIWKEPELLNIIANDLNNADIRLRSTAIDAIATAKCKEAEKILKEKLHDTSTKTRAKCVEALSKLGCIEYVLQLADDKEHDVRIEIAKAISLSPNHHTAKLAQQYITNDYEEIKLAALNSLASWKRIDLCGEILIESLQNRSLKVRKLSAEILSSYFPEAIELLATNSIADKDRINIVTKIRTQLNEYLQSLQSDDQSANNNYADNDQNENENENENKNENENDTKESIIVANNKSVFEPKRNNKINFTDTEIDDVFEMIESLNGSVMTSIQIDTIKRRLTNYGGKLLNILEYLYENYDDFAIPKLVENILAENNEIFALILQLDSDNALIRRKAASNLLRRSKIESLGGIASSQILNRSLEETDISMLMLYLGAVRNSDEYKARYLSAYIIQSGGRFESVELRRFVYEIFGEIGCGHDLIIVAQNIGDQRRDISNAAFVAMIKILRQLKDNEFEEIRVETATKLWSKFVASDLLSQVEISAAIYMLGDDSGAKSFLRASFSPDPRIRLHVANVIEVLADPDFMSVLIRFLDDKDTNVRRAALTILPKLADEDIGIIETEIPMEHELSKNQKKIARWKKWYAEKYK
ncbi:MAG: hypothetical protein LBE18_03700 [Planctomycetaceae bacterium]|nr:hypothetical protein [Planctomycetaceae bacterium]